MPDTRVMILRPAWRPRIPRRDISILHSKNIKKQTYFTYTISVLRVRYQVGVGRPHTTIYDRGNNFLFFFWKMRTHTDVYG